MIGLRVVLAGVMMIMMNMVSFNFKVSPRIVIIRRTKLDYSLYFKLSGDSKVKAVNNSFRLDVRKNFFSNRVVDA